MGVVEHNVPAPPPANRSRRGLRRGLRVIARHPRARRLLEGLALEFNEAVVAAAQPARSRALYLMALPACDPGGVDPAPLATAGFRPGVDDQALLGLIARAYAWHPDEQWDRARLDRELHRPGFSPEDVRLHFAGDALHAFCWTKRLRDHGGTSGLLFMVAVDPSARGAGLGRGIVRAGLERLRAEGVGEIMLYVDTTNIRAVKLYLDLGFEVVHTEHRFDQPPLVVPDPE